MQRKLGQNIRLNISMKNSEELDTEREKLTVFETIKGNNYPKPIKTLIAEKRRN